MKDLDIKVLQNELQGAMQKRIETAVDQVVQEVAHAVADDWKGRVPVDEGHYRDSIHVQKGKQPGYAMVRTALPDDDPYDIYYEYGTESQSPRPVARPAAERHRQSLPTRAARKLKDATGG